MKETLSKTILCENDNKCNLIRKSSKGITLISLAITVAIMIIIAGVTIPIGTDVIQNSKATKLNSELKIIHSKVNEIVEEKRTQEELNNLGNPISILSSDIQSKIQTAMQGASTDGFRYFAKSDLEAIGISDIDRQVIINFNTREVVDINGVKKNGEYIYRVDGWQNIIYQNKNTEAPEFNLSKKVYGLTAKVQVTNIEYKGNVGKGQLSYCLVNNNTEGNWKTVATQEFTVEQSGTYKVRLIDSAGNSTDKTIEIVLANKPKLDSGMTPVVYDSTLGKWKKVDENSGEWYDYASDKKQWANVMLQDGLVVNADGTIDNDKMGSMFVWIPRYMYLIPAANYHTSTAGEIKIKFLKGTTNIATDGTNVVIANASGGDNWNVHPAFCDGTKNNYANGEWDKDITGIWVAKFEASSENQANYSNYGGGNTTSLNIKVLPNVNSWKKIDIINIYNVCKKMTNNNNIYNLTENSNSHIMKNSEWGAITYITQSKYGNLQVSTDSTSGIWNNNYHNGDSYYTTLTGAVGESKNASTGSTSTTNVFSRYNEENGVKGSTTRNIYGIYDLAGGAWEFVAGYIVSTTDTYVDFFNDLPRHEKNTYIGNGDSSDEGKKANYQENKNKYGDALWEISSNNAGIGNNSWHSDISQFIHSSGQFFIRGAHYIRTSSAGMYAFYSETGNDVEYVSFRPVIVIN